MNRCEGIGDALNGDVGTMVETVQKLILRYYTDVGLQATESFESAKRISAWGFGILVFTIAYIVIVDAAGHFNWGGFDANYKGMGVGQLGLFAGAIVELIAGVQFVLYGKATKQFGAFHICLERTHRYLLAYKIADGIDKNRDETLQKIVCIMANAPMISARDIDGEGNTPEARPSPAGSKDPAMAAASPVPGLS